MRDLAKAQVAAGDEVHVLTATTGADGERHGETEDDDGVVVHRLGGRMPGDLPVSPTAPRRMRELIARLEPDVVHVHAGVISPVAYDGARVALESGVPLAITWHCMLDGWTPALRAVVRRSRWRGAPVALSAVSRSAAARVERVFGRPVAVMPNGTDMRLWGPTARRSDGALRCVATMRLAPRKRGLALIDTVADAAAQLGPGALHLDLVGDGPQRAAIGRRVRRRGMSSVVTVHGRLDRLEVRKLYDEADVFLAPASLEAFGIAALEARATGLVVVARAGTGIEEFVTDGVDGLLVDDDAAMARALVHLTTDLGLRRRLLERSRAEPPPFDRAMTVLRAHELYDRARAQRPG
ncbi:glycosyltransferase family 4 protein [Cellulomonas bogoriensis]